MNFIYLATGASTLKLDSDRRLYCIDLQGVMHPFYDNYTTIVPAQLEDFEGKFFSAYAEVMDDIHALKPAVLVA